MKSMLSMNRVLAIFAICLLSGCHDSASPDHEAAAPAETAEKPEMDGQVVLEPEAVEKMGIVTTPAATATFNAETAGFGVVLGHDAIAQAVADMATAEASLHQSRLAMARVKTLAATPGAMSFEAQETAERQVTADDIALTLAGRKFSATFGENPPWTKLDSPIVRDIASGKLKIVRATFSVGEIDGTKPNGMRVSRLGDGGGSWTGNTIWNAPADATVPGRSVFVLIKNTDLGEGERVNVWAAGDASESGVLVPKSAVVLSESSYWCYIEKPAGTFIRTAVDIGQPLTTGYFVKEGIAVGDPIVTTSAGLLLARETNASTEAE